MKLLLRAGLSISLKTLNRQPKSFRTLKENFTKKNTSKMPYQLKNLTITTAILKALILKNRMVS